mgnify:CR=1 FL=1
MKQCIKCGHELADDAVSCHICGEKQVSENKKCSNCGTPIEWGVFCPNCGTKNEPSDFENPNDNSKTEILYEERIQSENLHNTSVNQQEINKDKKAENSGCFSGCITAFLRLIIACFCLFILLGIISRLYFSQHEDKAEELASNIFNLAIGNDKNFAESLDWTMKAAQEGDVEAQYNLGNAYYYGFGTTINRSEGIKWLKKAALQGHVAAKQQLLEIEDQGRNRIANYTIHELIQVAKQGDAEAQFLLALKYYKGKDLNQNRSEAFKWAKKSAEQGFAKAQFMLGNLYFLGEGTAQNNREAAKWFRKADEQKLPEAKNMLEMLKFKESLDSTINSFK